MAAKIKYSQKNIYPAPSRKHSSLFAAGMKGKHGVPTGLGIPREGAWIYLDYAAATPLDAQVKKTMQPFLEHEFANPSALYSKGRKAKKAIEDARSKIANLIGARSQEIIFTAGGTESANLAIFGVARNFEIVKKFRGHIIASAIEHHAVLNPIKHLVGEGWNASFIKVDNKGFVKLGELESAIRTDTVLISIMYANNEIGTIEPIAEIGKWLKTQNVKRKARNLHPILFYTDACQAAGALDINVNHLGVDLMTINGSKIYGPKQTGFLYVKAGTPIQPLIYGGGQERNLRSGTENVPGIVGLAKALELVQKNRHKENERLKILRDYFIRRLLNTVDSVQLNGPLENDTNAHKRNQSKIKLARLPNNINISIPGIEGESLVLYLDAFGISVSSKSACDTPHNDPSHVLVAIGRTKSEAEESIRLTLGKKTTKAKLDYVIKILPQIIRQLKKAI